MKNIETKYITNVLNVLKEKQELALREFNRTDFNSPAQYDDVQRWFSEIEKRIKKTPPVHWVHCLHIFESDEGKAFKIEYEYADVETCERDPYIRLHTEML